MHIEKAPLRKQWNFENSFAVLLDDFVLRREVIKVIGILLDVGSLQVLEEVLNVMEWVQNTDTLAIDNFRVIAVIWVAQFAFLVWVHYLTAEKEETLNYLLII